MVPWALDLASDVLDLGLRLTLFTNGIPLGEVANARRVAELVRRGALVRVSLAGVSRGSCDEISGANRRSGLGLVDRLFERAAEGSRPQAQEPADRCA